MVINFNCYNIIYIMNKLYKILLGVFIIWIWIVNTTNATNIACDDFDTNSLIWDNWTINVIGQDDCYKEFNIDNDNILYLISVNSIENTEDWELTIWDWYIYSNDNTNYNYWILTAYRSLTLDLYSENSKIYTISWRKLTNTDLYSIFNSWYTICQTCEEQYTSLECQTEYNLIPITDVTANYCKLNFDLIEPTECPNIWEWTGEINWTAWYINNQQYPWTASLRLNIEDFLQRQTTYNEEETIVDVIWYNADETYIDNIINNTKTWATPQDFENLIYTLTWFTPYVLMMILVTFMIWLVKKLFKS